MGARDITVAFNGASVLLGAFGGSTSLIGTFSHIVSYTTKASHGAVVYLRRRSSAQAIEFGRPLAFLGWTRGPPVDMNCEIHDSALR